jgi:hypothetical protein
MASLQFIRVSRAILVLPAGGALPLERLPPLHRQIQQLQRGSSNPAADLAGGEGKIPFLLDRSYAADGEATDDAGEGYGVRYARKEERHRRSGRARRRSGEHDGAAGAPAIWASECDEGRESNAGARRLSGARDTDRQA